MVYCVKSCVEAYLHVDGEDSRRKDGEADEVEVGGVPVLVDDRKFKESHVQVEDDPSTDGRL